MAIYKEDIVDIELESGVIHRTFLHHSIGLGDAKANRFGVRLYRNGEAENIGTATLTALFMAPNGQNQIINETNFSGSTTIDGNVAYVTLPSACYANEGQFCLAIKLNKSGVTTTMRIVDGMVANTGVTGATVPATPVPTSDQILAAYDAAVAMAQASVRFDTDQSLSATQKTTARTNIEAAGLAQVVRVDADQSLTSAQKLQARENIDAVGKGMITETEYDADATYSAGEYCTWNGQLRRSQVDGNIGHTPGESTTAYWAVCTAMGQVKTAIEDIAAPYDPNGEIYEKDDYCSFNRKIYRAKRLTGDGTFVQNDWDEVDIANDLKTVIDAETAARTVDDSELKSAINELDTVAVSVKHEVTITKDSSGNAYADYTIKGGNVYQFINDSGTPVVAQTVAAKTSSASAIESITGGLANGLTIVFTPSLDAEYVRVYFSGTPTGNVQLFEYNTTTQTVADIENTYGLIINQKILTTGGQGRCSTFFPMVVGKSYRFTNLGSGGASIVAQTKASSSTVTETIASGTDSGDIVTFVPSLNASVVRIDTDGATSILMEEVGTLYDNAKLPTKKPYQSGQIHFTIPVNQQRLYFTQGSADTAQDNETNIVNVDCVLMLPLSYTQSGAKTNLLMICHGSGGGVTPTSWFRNDSTVLAFFQKFIDAGFAIFDCNGYKNGSEGQESWGVDTASIAYHKAYEYVVKNYNVTEEMCVYGFSMGGLNALNYCNMFPGGIKAIGLGAPVVSLYNTVWVDMSVQAKGDVSRAYGFAVSGTYEADTVGNCDPYVRIKNIDSSNYYLQRLPTIKIWHGDSDTAVYYQYSQNLYNSIINSGGFAYYRLVNGKGHEICYGGNTNVANEIIMYFKRFVI